MRPKLWKSHIVQEEEENFEEYYSSWGLFFYFLVYVENQGLFLLYNKEGKAYIYV